MTTVVGIQYDDKAVLVSDSLMTTSSSKYVDPRMSKIVQRGKYLIARSGDVNACDIIQHIWRPPTPTAKDKVDLFHFVIAKVVPSLRKCLKDNDYTLEKAPDEATRFVILIVVSGQLFEIDDDFAVAVREDGFYGIGSGSDYAVGALYAGATAQRAVEIASQLDPNTGGHIITVEQCR